MSIKGIICGLGNPGAGYLSTRHNIGFMALDRLMETVDGSPREQIGHKKETPDYIAWQWSSLGSPDTWLLIKPMTFMNRSGSALSKVFSRSPVEVASVLIIHDEVDLPLGKIKIKAGGGLAGHNGLRSIASHLGTRDFARLRIGVGRPEDGSDLAGYVLNKFLPREFEMRDQVLDRAAQAIITFRDHGLDSARQQIAALSNQPSP
ncbi:MAG: aminoacyl-tRNA hydrolase [Desulfonatronovibrio sp.]